MFRLYFAIFWNKPLTAHHHHQGEGGPAMLFPLVLLAIGATAAGFIPFGKYVSADGRPLAGHLDILFSIAPVALALAGILLAAVLFRKQSERPASLAASLGSIYRAALNKFYIDEVYRFVTKKIIFNLVGRPAAWFDRNVVDGLMNLTGNGTIRFSAMIKRMQSGKVQVYAFYFLAGVLGLAALFIYILN
jgi:NADH-quinone oxidoreductase subunit L